MLNRWWNGATVKWNLRTDWRYMVTSFSKRANNIDLTFALFEDDTPGIVRCPQAYASG